MMTRRNWQGAGVVATFALLLTIGLAIFVLLKNPPPEQDVAHSVQATFSGTPHVGHTLTLDGAGSNIPDTLTYAWTQISGPMVAISKANEANATVTPPAAGSYIFRLTVNDGTEMTTDDVTIEVTDPVLTISTATWSMQVTDNGLSGLSTRTLTYDGTGTVTVKVSSSESWLSVAFDNGAGGNTLGPGATGTVAATVTSVAGLNKGSHTATIIVAGNDGTSHQAQISFELTYADPISGGQGGGGGACAATDSARPNPLWLLLVPLFLWVHRVARRPMKQTAAPQVIRTNGGSGRPADIRVNAEMSPT